MDFNLENGNLEWDNLNNRHYKLDKNVVAGNMKTLAGRMWPAGGKLTGPVRKKHYEKLWTLKNESSGTEFTPSSHTRTIKIKEGI